MFQTYEVSTNVQSTLYTYTTFYDYYQSFLPYPVDSTKFHDYYILGSAGASMIQAIAWTHLLIQIII